MKNTLVVTAAISMLFAGVTFGAGQDSHGGRPPSAGDAASKEGGTGSKAMNEGTQAGAPGNVVTAAEGSVMTGHDVDADGYVSKMEAQKNGDLAKQFAKLDLNADGKLDESEFKGFTPSVSAVTGTAPHDAKDAKVKKDN